MNEFMNEATENFKLRQAGAECKTNVKCHKCGSYLYLSDLPQYDYVCYECDENFFECEVQTGTYVNEFTMLPYTHVSKEQNDVITEIMEDYKRLVKKAKRNGLDIRLYPESATLELYFNDDYPDTLLVDKYFSNKRKDEDEDD